VPNAPFSAIVDTQWVRQLADGTNRVATQVTSIDEF